MANLLHKLHSKDAMCRCAMFSCIVVHCALCILHCALCIVHVSSHIAEYVMTCRSWVRVSSGCPATLSNYEFTMMFTTYHCHRDTIACIQASIASVWGVGVVCVWGGGGLKGQADTWVAWPGRRNCRWRSGGLGGPVREKATGKGACKEALADRERGIMTIVVKLYYQRLRFSLVIRAKFQIS